MAAEKNRWDPCVPAREKTPFGDFELKASHLKTSKAHYIPATTTSPPIARAAAVTIADRVPMTEVREMLEMLGLVNLINAHFEETND